MKGADRRPREEKLQPWWQVQSRRRRDGGDWKGGRGRGREGMRMCVYLGADLCRGCAHPGKRNTMLLPLRMTMSVSIKQLI